MRQNAPCIYLGETNNSTIEFLSSNYSCEEFIVEFKKDDIKGKSFLPPWVFDYPDYCYKKIQDSIKIFQNITSSGINLGLHKHGNFYPLLLVAGFHPNESINFKEIPEKESNFLCKIAELVRNDKLTLGNLYLLILKNIILQIKQNLIEFLPVSLIKYIFIANNYYLPLVVFDPLKIIYTLIHSLNSLCEAILESVEHFDKFKLLSLNILIARSPSNDKWYTLLAYCGGFIKEKGKCGFAPLVFGNHKTCEKCLKLICPECNFCSAQCNPESRWG
jgi:hypothetical protein